MNDIGKEFAGKKITVMGLGLLGRGVGDVEFLAKCGAQVLVTDKKTEAELGESVGKLRHFPNVTFHLGAHEEKDFTDCDMVFKAAGVPLDSPYIAAARAAGVPVYMSTAFFAKYAMGAGATVVGITGTRGKSTTTQMIYYILRSCENQILTKVRETVSHEQNVLLGGNIRGVSTLSLLPEVTKDTIVVLELDSWQLQGFGDLNISPQVAVFTNLMPDHQNYYPDMDAYFADKAKLFTSQKEGNVLVCGASVRDRMEAARPKVLPRVPPALPADWVLKIPGEHNRENASLAAAALRYFGLTENEIKVGLESFQGVEGRFQYVGERDGISVYNDSNATTPDATIAALKALSAPRQGSGQNQNIILILGGADKGLDMGTLLYEIARTCKRVIMLSGTGSARVAPLMQDVSIYDSLENAVGEALTSAGAGDIILFSPAFASFGMFKNEYERNDQFMSLVNKWLKK